jgi:shikimate dehydrogenase
VRAAVLGSPIAHSRSPALHRAAYVALGLDWTYDAIECTSGELAGLLSGLGPEWAGLSLTMPLKQAVLPLLDTVTDLARDVAAANTVVLRDGVRHGDNTDVHGIVAALREAGVVVADRAVVLGGGATARSALAALRELGCDDIGLVVRSEPVETLAAGERLGVSPRVVGPEMITKADLVISTLPAGAGDALCEHVVGVPALLDVVYAPWPTALASACGGVVVGGAAMLLHHAARQVELMTGHPAPLAAMRAALP